MLLFEERPICSVLLLIFIFQGTCLLEPPGFGHLSLWMKVARYFRSLRCYWIGLVVAYWSRIRSLENPLGIAHCLRDRSSGHAVAILAFCFFDSCLWDFFFCYRGSLGHLSTSILKHTSMAPSTWFELGSHTLSHPSRYRARTDLRVFSQLEWVYRDDCQLTYLCSRDFASAALKVAVYIPVYILSIRYILCSNFFSTAMICRQRTWYLSFERFVITVSVCHPPARCQSSWSYWAYCWLWPCSQDSWLLFGCYQTMELREFENYHRFSFYMLNNF